MQDYEIGAGHLPHSELDLLGDSNIIHTFTSLGEVALRAYNVNTTPENKLEKLKENIEIDLHKANTVIEIRKPGKDTTLGEVIGYISGNSYELKLPEDNPLNKETLRIFRIYGAAVIPEMQGQGAGQILLSEVLDTVKVDVLTGETNNPQAVLARIKAVKNSKQGWTIVWGKNQVSFGNISDNDKLNYVVQQMYQETLQQRIKDAKDDVDINIEPIDTNLFKSSRIINAPAFIGSNKLDEQLLKALPNELQATYLEMADLSKEAGGKPFSAPIYSINHSIFKL